MDSSSPPATPALAPPRPPTPSSTVRTLVLVRPEPCDEDIWSTVEAAAFAAGGREVWAAGHALFAFAQPADALQFCLELPALSGSLRAAVHVGDLRQQPTAIDRTARGAPATTARIDGLQVLGRLIAGCATGQRLLSRPAAAVLRRAAAGQPVTLPAGWECRIGSGDDAVMALSLEPVHEASPPGDAPTLPDLRQPLPSRPHWWLERPLPKTASLARVLLRNQKTGLCAVLQTADGEAGRSQLLAQRDACQRLSGAYLLSPGDGELDVLPAFLVSELGNGRLLPDWWSAQQRSAEAALLLLLGIAEAMHEVHAAGCAHGALDGHAIAIGRDDRVRLWGVREVDDLPQRLALQQADCAAVGRLAYGLAAGDPEAEPGAFWERRVDSAPLRELIRSCLDPGHPQPIREMSRLVSGIQRLQRTVESGSTHGDPGPARWRTGLRRLWSRATR